ncbi:membrane protein [Pannonibacter phragmitetus]|uniref:DUF924 family protein n=1 Tax=Pannonibacter phragmitetus TaxID=121719 RepID=UPI00067B7EFC|nr:DUF924 family protein [Pannonibacter phragmitetus]KND17841.1 membrane protein [Pannonibacter phragmitetus]
MTGAPTPTQASAADPLTVLNFWWEAGSEAWFTRSDAFDAEIRSHFVPLMDDAASGALDHWQETPHGTLALLLLLDQFPRNVYRQDKRAFATDAKARIIATAALARGFDKAFPKDARAFFYLPFEHAEDMAEQEKSVDLFRRLGDKEFYLYALVHLDVIRRFGRFPHRNHVLERETTAEEAAYLADGGFSA